MHKLAKHSNKLIERVFLVSVRPFSTLHSCCMYNVGDKFPFLNLKETAYQ